MNGMLVHNQTGVVPDVRYVSPAILDLVQNCLAFVVASRFIIRVYQNLVLVRDCIVPIDPMFVRAVLNVRVAVAKALMFTWAICPCALCALS